LEKRWSRWLRAKFETKLDSEVLKLRNEFLWDRLDSERGVLARAERAEFADRMNRSSKPKLLKSKNRKKPALIY
jgi:hypothetical protein